MRKRSLKSVLAAGVTATLVGAAASLATVGTAHAAPTNTTGAAATSGGIKVAYFDQWSIYQNAFYVKNLDTGGIAGNLTYLLYDFENIDPTNLTCFETEHGVDQDPAGESDPSAGDGAGDMDADYGKPFNASQTVNGVADTSSQPIAGNFNQLKELKAKYPNLHILLSIGGWTYSKYFSDVAASSASRQKFVSSCINMFINGNLPLDSNYGPTYGGNGSAAGIFDGFDVDWEYPASSGGHLGNHTSPSDTANYTALLQEFRSELDTAGQTNGKTYYLSAALPSGQDKIDKIQTNQIGQYLTFGDAMTYDMYGAWNATGPTDEQDPLYANPNSPESKVAPGNETYSIDNAIRAWTVGDSQYGIAGGFPANKLTAGLPFYYRGWTGVPAGSNHGLYQTATGASAGQTDSGNVPGVAMYKEITNIVANSADTYWDPVTQSAYFYDGTNFYGGEDAQSIQVRADYAHCNGLGGFMMFSLYDLDPSATLFNDAVNDINGSASSCSGGPSTSPSASASSSASASATASASASASASPSGSSGGGSGGNLLTNPGFESGSTTGWMCSSADSVVMSPVHSGSYALSGAPSGSDYAQCSQTVSVQPGTTYSFSGWVDGSYVYLGGNAGSGDVNSWTAGTSGYQQLSASILTGASQTSLTVYVHGWYGEPAFYADDFSLTGPGGSGGGTPSASASASSSPSMSPSMSASASASASPSGSPGGGSGAVVNGGFESGSLAPWTCSPLGSVTTSPVHSGSYALQGAANSSDYAQCSQSITVSPNTKYTLTAWVDGSYVYLGDTGTGTNDTSTWTAGTNGSYQQLTTSFTTGANTTSVTIWLHGWYGQGTYYADDITTS